MTFGEIVRTDLSILGMGARAHSELASNNPKAISECLARDDWTCCICRTRIPGFMEVDHVQSHGPCQADQLRTICQFCHNLRHPLWAALRGRFRIFWAPGLEQLWINRIAWHVLFASRSRSDGEIDSDLNAAAQQIFNDVSRRETVLADILGGSDALGFWEALFTAKSLIGRG